MILITDENRDYVTTTGAGRAMPLMGNKRLSSSRNRQVSGVHFVDDHLMGVGEHDSDDDSANAPRGRVSETFTAEA